MRVDHFSFTVPDLDEAVKFFGDLMGADVAYRMGPFHVGAGFMAVQFGVHPSAAAEVAMLRGPDCGIELYQFSVPAQRTSHRAAQLRFGSGAVAPWGLQIKPAGQPGVRACYAVPDLVRAKAFLARLGPAPNVEFVEDPLVRLPRNDDIGGHHLAFHADDVDAAVTYLRTLPGVAVQGVPQTVDRGPIAGCRWVYFRAPWGLQMEVLKR